MKKHSKNIQKEELRNKIMGFGEKSVRKNFFPDLQHKTEEHKHGLKLLNQVNDAICFIDLDTYQILDYNLAFADYFALPNTNIKGRIFLNLILNENVSLTKQTLEQIKLGSLEKLSLVLKYEIQNADKIMVGETSFSLSRLGGANFFIAVVRDITDRVAAENRLKNMNVQLEKKVEERTNKLKEINAELEQFAYIVSHDLKAPLRGISQIAYWLKNDFLSDLEPEGLELLDMLMQRVNILDQIIAGILQYSRVGRTETDKELIDLKELIDEVHSLFDTNKKFELQTKLENNFIIAHKIRIEQVIQNLVDNAIRYGDKEKTIVTIESYDLSNSWKIIVRDNGPGISKKYHDKVFKIFQTLHPKEVNSTGIGLSIIKKIIELYDGTIHIDSVLGKGTSFIINIPKSQS